jgi:anti-sigma B factor antagonist
MKRDAGRAVFRARLIHLDGYAAVAVAGELDLAAVTILQPVLDGLITDGHADLRLNASALTFLDAAGIGCLIQARQRALEVGGRLRIDSLRGSPLRVLVMCGLLPLFASDPTIAEDGSPISPIVHTDAMPRDTNPSVE